MLEHHHDHQHCPLYKLNLRTPLPLLGLLLLPRLLPFLSIVLLLLLLFLLLLLLLLLLLSLLLDNRWAGRALNCKVFKLRRIGFLWKVCLSVQATPTFPCGTATPHWNLSCRWFLNIFVEFWMWKLLGICCKETKLPCQSLQGTRWKGAWYHIELN